MGILSACQTSRPVHIMTPMVSNGAPVAAAPAPAPVVPNPIYKVGNPYQVGGIWYYPQEQPAYDETGIASWYGIDYHGRLTANGEVFDRNGVSGAHPTLPMPVNVRVTNLENGRSLVVRVNDRGPYVNGRIIDLSEHAADLLGFRLNGLARVRVSYIGRADLYGPGLASPADETPPEIASAVPAAPVTQVDAMALPPVAGVAVAPPVAARNLPKPVEQTILPPPSALGAADGQVVEIPVPSATALYVQAGAFTSPVNAGSVAARLSSTGARVFPGTKDGRPIYRVRIGPFQAVEQADAVLAQVLALGQNDVQIVVDAVSS
ncbi:MAG TPA: septal ring lytic transglycosylase RlpA family protein [Micropepsaceae bacterium]|nr:septal ring lytic transglycosylase RlpA family protein [Micropepsaceae bacterium]